MTLPTYRQSTWKLTDVIVLIAAEHNNALYLELAHGGHLGFYEGGLVYPNPVTWLDRALVALVGSLALVNADASLKTGAGMAQ